MFIYFGDKRRMNPQVRDSSIYIFFNVTILVVALKIAGAATVYNEEKW